MLNFWTIGAHPGSDMVVSHPSVMGRHCRLTRDAQGYVLEDLGSGTGTFVNGTRIRKPTRVSTSDVVTLGPSIRMPWPSVTPAARSELRIGRAPDNDFVVNQVIVSGYHARVTRGKQPGQGIIEDLGSANGTAIGSPDRKITRSAFGLGDTVFLGTFPVAGSEIMGRLDPSIVASGMSRERSSAAPQGSTVRVTRGSASPGGSSSLLIRLAILLSAGPLLAFGISTLAWTESQIRPDSSRGPASALFWVGLAALGLGASGSILIEVIDRDRNLSPDRLGILSALGLFQVGIVWSVVAILTGLGAGWLPSMGLLGLSWLVGLSLGCLILLVSPGSMVTWSALMMLMGGFWVFGGGPESIPRSLPLISSIGELTPSRWVFEGLLTIEGQARPVGDLAEEYFPIATDRMGLKADLMALVSIQVGLLLATGFVIGAWRWNRGSFSGP